MPTLLDEGGKPVDTDIDADAVNRQFAAAMAATPGEGELPKRPETPPAPEAPKPRRGRPPKAEQPRTAGKSGSALTDDDRAAGVKGWAQILAGMCAMAGRATGSPAWTADAVVIASAADDIAGACVQVAHADARFAAALDKVCSVGPYGALISVGLGIGTQVLRNHRPGMELPGTVHPDQLLAAAMQSTEA